MGSMTRWLSRLLFSAVAAVALIMSAAGPAAAQAVLVETSPAANAVLDSPPTEVVLTFSEPVEPVEDQIRITGPDGERADDGEPELRGNELVLRLRQDPPQGTYLVSYRVVSANDGSPVAGGFTFSIGVESTPTAPDQLQQDDPLVARALNVAKYLGYAGLALITGATLMLSLLWPRRLSKTAPRRVFWTGVVLVAASTVLAFYVEAAYTTGVGLFEVSSTALSAVADSTFGIAHLVRLVALIAAVPILLTLMEERGRRADLALLALPAVVGLLSWPLSGHPNASPYPWLALPVDLVHLTAMSVWVGGLVILAGFLLPRAYPSEVTAVLPVWSRWATAAMACLVIAGVTQAVIEVRTPQALVTTRYGWLIVTKAVLLLGVLALASRARSFALRYAVPAAVAAPAPRAGQERYQEQERHQEDENHEDEDNRDEDNKDSSDVESGEANGDPGSAPDDQSGDEPDDEPESEADDELDAQPPEPSPTQIRRLRWLIVVEIAIAAVILGVTAVLVQTPPARTEADTADQAASVPTTITLTSELYTLNVEIDPGEVGANSLHLFALTPQGAPATVVEWSAIAIPPDRDADPVTVPLLALSDDHAIGEVTLRTAGEWEFQFTLRLAEGEQDTVTSVIRVK